MMDILREKIARAILDAMDVQDGLDTEAADKYADAILAIPELKEALEKAGHWSDGVELPAKVIGKLCDFYAGEKVIRVRDD